MAQTLLGVAYDAHTLAIRRIIIPHDDNSLHLHVGAGEALATRLLSLGTHTIDDAMEIVARKTGRHPPDMESVHAADHVSRGMTGGGLRVI